MTNRYADTRFIALADINGGTLATIVGAGAAVVTAFIAGLWQHLSGRKKSDSDAQTTLVNGFISLLSELKNERTQMISRISDLERDNHKQDRRISKLERIMIRHNIEIPNGNEQ